VKEWITVEAAALVAGRSKRTVYEWVRTERIASRMIGGKVHVLSKAAARLGEELKRGRPAGVPTRR
jgi:hypothetical protein